MIVYAWLKAKESKFNINKTFIDKWINKYENWLEHYPDNNDTIWIERDDTSGVQSAIDITESFFGRKLSFKN